MCLKQQGHSDVYQALDDLKEGLLILLSVLNGNSNVWDLL